ncbi:MAG TPA: response regulator [Noviherbaspirillum sp.]|jgi:DNA-binding NtrC family response regulator|uniref:response regulator n=1 Tax=Noviherbaspirillum sp. TaxID=1926288 RepID=UPI002F92168A
MVQKSAGRQLEVQCPCKVIAAARLGRHRMRGYMATTNDGRHDDDQACKVLLVDDDLDLLEVTATLFRQYGYEVVTATDGTEAREVLNCTQDIEVLLTDVALPGLGGVQLAHEARRLRRDMKIILVSGNLTMTDASGLVDSFEFLMKPYRISDVLRLLAKPTR